MTACDGDVITKTTDSLDQQGQASASDSEARASERTATGTMLLGGKETTVYLEVGDTEINFWDSASGRKLLAVAKYPETLAGAADALKSCDYTDLDEDGNSDLTAEFTFASGSTATLSGSMQMAAWSITGNFPAFPARQLLPGQSK